MFSMLPPSASMRRWTRERQFAALTHSHTHSHTYTNTCTILGSLLTERAYLIHSAKVVLARRLLRARPRYESFDVKLFECNYIFWFEPELSQALFETVQGLTMLSIHFYMSSLYYCIQAEHLKIGTFISTYTHFRGLNIIYNKMKGITVKQNVFIDIRIDLYFIYILFICVIYFIIHIL